METKERKYNESLKEIVIDESKMTRNAIFETATKEIMNGNVNISIVGVENNNLLLYINLLENRSSGKYTDLIASNYEKIWFTWVKENKDVKIYMDEYREYKRNLNK